MFDKVFVISYIKNFDRRKTISEKLNNLNIDFEFLYGPNLYDIPSYEMVKMYSTAIGEKYYVHDISGSIPHLNAVEYAYYGGYNNVLIMEDDCLFIDNKDFILHCLNNYPEDADLIQYGYIDCMGSLKNEHPSIFILHDYFPGAQMYALCNRKVMKDYIDSQHNHYASADNIYIFKEDNHQYKKYVVYPQIAIDPYWHNEHLSDKINTKLYV